MDELELCINCSSEVTYWGSECGHQILCKSCGTTLTDTAGTRDIIETWNRFCEGYDQPTWFREESRKLIIETLFKAFYNQECQKYNALFIKLSFEDFKKTRQGVLALESSKDFAEFFWKKGFRIIKVQPNEGNSLPKF